MMPHEEYSIVRYYLNKIVIAGLVTIAILWVITPFVIAIAYAFTDPDQYYSISVVFPTSFTADHVKMLLALGADKAIMNSIIVAVLTIIFSFALGLPAGYAFARYTFKGKDSLKLFIIGLRMFPIMVIAVPLVTLYLRLGLNDTLLGVALAHTSMALPFVILITSSIIAGIPKELEEAAMVFGLDRKGAFIHVTMPLALPGLTAAAIFTFLMSWNEVFIASVLTLTNRTLTAFILNTAMAAVDFIKFAGAFIIIFPAMIFVFIARRYLISMWGITLR
ncbi:carbohydrate ABC transporter permease [Desulfurococcaceae archaeon MEX13E-LK6-19]|nr:carbohydrate ABC transporter permease [Desulfurococcaceae archaeon MEX13E-LK6-19]